MVKIILLNGQNKRTAGLRNFAKSVCTDLKKMFGEEPKVVKIVICKNARFMEDQLDRKLRSWEVAVTKQNTIFILDVAVMQKRHPKVQNFKTILHHELVHVFYNHLIPEGVPYWLNEGLAYNLAKQEFPLFRNSSIAKRALRYYSNYDQRIYRYGPALTRLLIKNNTLDVVMRALRTFATKSHRPAEFDKIFQPLVSKI